MSLKDKFSMPFFSDYADRSFARTIMDLWSLSAKNSSVLRMMRTATQENDIWYLTSKWIYLFLDIVFQLNTWHPTIIESSQDIWPVFWKLTKSEQLQIVTHITRYAIQTSVAIHI